MNRKNESHSERHAPASSNPASSSSVRLRRSSSSANLNRNAASKRASHANPSDTMASSSSTSRIRRQPSNLFSRNRSTVHPPASSRRPHNESQNVSSDIQRNFPPQAQTHHASGISSPFSTFDSVSTPVLSIRKGSQQPNSSAAAWQLSRMQQGKSQAPMGHTSQPTAKTPESQIPQSAATAASLLSLTCPTCGTSFPDRDSYKKHLAVLNHGHSCAKCGNKFADKGNLNRHIKTVHEKEKPYICDQCGMGFSFRDSLRRHVDAVHWSIRPFRCANCEKSYKKKDHLRRHLLASPGHKAANQ